MKLTAASLAAQSAEAFDGSPEVAGELEGWVRYVLTKEGNTLLVADTKEDGEQKAKCVRFNFDKLPDGCGKGAKVKLSGIQFVKKVGRDYNGKTYYDMVYSFAACEVLEAGAARGFGGKPGGGWQPRSPAENASIEAQAIAKAAAEMVGRMAQGCITPETKGADLGAPVCVLLDLVFEDLWDHVQKAKRQAAASAPRPEQEPGGASQPAGQAGRPASGSGTDSQKSAASNSGNPGRFPVSLSDAGKEIATKIGKLVVEMFGQQEAPVALARLTGWIDQNGVARLGLQTVSHISSERQAKAIMCTLGPMHHWWKTANATNKALLADIVLKSDLPIEERAEELKALLATKDEPAGAPSDAGDIEVLSPFEMPAEEWTLFLSQVQEASGEHDLDTVTGLIDKTAMRLFTGAKYKPLKAKFLSEEAVAAVLAELRK